MFFSRTTLNETFTAKYDSVLPRTPYVRPKSEIYTPVTGDDKHPHPFHMRSPSPGLNSIVLISAAEKGSEGVVVGEGGKFKKLCVSLEKY